MSEAYGLCHYSNKKIEYSNKKIEYSIFVCGGGEKVKFYEFIEYLEKINPDKVIMVKSGAFFNAIGRDAIVLERVLGLKRTCHAKFLCKCGLPVTYVRENMETLKNRLKEKNISIAIYDEVNTGRYEYNNKKYDVIFELEGESIKENRKNIDCINCKNHVYNKNINKYVIEKEDFEKIMKNIKTVIENVINKK